MLDLWRWRFDLLPRRRSHLHFVAALGVATGSRWGVETGVGLGVEISSCDGFTSGVCFGVVKIRWPGPAGSAPGPLRASFPQLALPRCGESQKHAVYSAQAAGYL